MATATKVSLTVEQATALINYYNTQSFVPAEANDVFQYLISQLTA